MPQTSFEPTKSQLGEVQDQPVQISSSGSSPHQVDENVHIPDEDVDAQVQGTSVSGEQTPITPLSDEGKQSF